MYPGYRVHAVTNGVHAGTWTHPSFARLFDANFPQWQHEPEILMRALQLPDEDVWRAHQQAKADLVALVSRLTATALNPEQMIVGFARRMTGYKRPHLLFEHIERLVALGSHHPLQVVMAGKAHPRDQEGKEGIRRISEFAERLRPGVTCVFLPNYDMQMAQTLVAGSDIWLNTPLPPLEASGTSGMKAALNGVLNVSVLDGWWVEACIEGVTGWAIGKDGDDALPQDHAIALCEKLERTVAPLYYSDGTQWRTMMKQAIGMIGYYFNSQRMMRRYATEAYLR
jgi:starch phosphorylase